MFSFCTFTFCLNRSDRLCMWQVTFFVGIILNGSMIYIVRALLIYLCYVFSVVYSKRAVLKYDCRSVE